MPSGSSLASHAPVPRPRVTAVDGFLGARIRERRIGLGLSSYELAERIDVTYQQVHKYEHGINRISAGRLYEIACALNTPITYFYEGLDDRERDRITARQGRQLDMARNLDGIDDKQHLEAISLVVRALAGR
jgi:transcriptional regulator with XRE-family HTH domain